MKKTLIALMLMLMTCLPAQAMEEIVEELSILYDKRTDAELALQVIEDVAPYPFWICLYVAYFSVEVSPGCAKTVIEEALEVINTRIAELEAQL